MSIRRPAGAAVRAAPNRRRRSTAGDSAVAAVAAADPQSSTQVLAVASGPVQVPPARDPLPLLLYVVAAVVALVAIFGPPAVSVYYRKDREPV